MAERLKTAIPLIIIVALAFAIPRPYSDFAFAALAIAMIAAGCHEAFTMLNIAKGKTFQAITTVFSILLVLVNVLFFQENDQINGVCSYLFTGLFILALFLIVFKHGPTVQMLDSAFISMGIFLYITWSLLCMVKTYYFPCQNGTDGRHLLIFMIVVTKMADVGAYIVGSSTAKMAGGNHKIAPRLSPKKSWEGLLGGTLFSTITAVILVFITPLIDLNGAPVFSFLEAIAFGIIASVVGLLGDLAESAIKRAHNFKDSGKIPGIGGMLDVLDSLIPIAPIFFAFIILKW